MSFCGRTERRTSRHRRSAHRSNGGHGPDRHANLKYKYGNRHFWCRGYYVDTVGKNEKKIAEYVKNQLQEDLVNDQISMKEYIDPFTGEKWDKKK